MVVCAGIIAIVGTATLGVIAALAKSAEPGLTRDLALMTAQNVLERARAAAAYLPPQVYTNTQNPNDLRTRTKGWVLNAAAQFTAHGRMPGTTCDGRPNRPADVALAVTTAYDGNTNVFSVTVTYPRNPCIAQQTASVVVQEALPPSVLLPGTRVYEPLAHEPTKQ